MSGKSFYAAFLAATMISLTGCSLSGNDQPKPDTTSEQKLKIYKVDNIPSSVEPEKETVSKLGPDDPYPVSHTLYDRSLTFTDEVAVINYYEVDAYDPDGNEVTVSSDVDLTGCKYAFVYYTDYHDFLFQKVVKSSKTDTGETVLILSGIPLEQEMDKKDFLGLIVDADLYGNRKGEKEDGFKENPGADSRIP